MVGARRACNRSFRLRGYTLLPFALQCRVCMVVVSIVFLPARSPRIVRERLSDRLQVQLIYEALECILLRLASTDGRTATAHWQNTASKTVVESLLGGAGASGAAGGCLRRLYASLSLSRKSVHIKAALRLLAAVVVQGEWAAKEFSLHFDLEHNHVLPLLGRRDAKASAPRSSSHVPLKFERECWCFHGDLPPGSARKTWSYCFAEAIIFNGC